MNLKTLSQIPPWDWPDGTDKMLLDVLRDDATSEPDLLLAAELAGDSTVINDELAEELLSILRSSAKSEEVRAQAAISLGPALEDADTDGFEEPPYLSTIAERTFDTIRESLRALYVDAGVPKDVRRRILEASVRAPQDWQQGAIRAAYASGDASWRLTAVFCMRFVRGFDEHIVEALDSDSEDIRYEAVLAAGSWEVAGAWPHVVALVTSSRTPKQLLLAAITAVASIRPAEALTILDDLLDSDDEEVVAAVEEALALAEGPPDEDGEPDDDRDE
jgi:uncharacterized protein (UPF0147 family)